MNQLQTKQSNLEDVLLKGDLAALSPQQKVDYHNKVCELVGLNPLTRPFDYLTFQGKTVLYANKNCAEQLRKVHTISITECNHNMVGDTLIVTVKAKDGSGREDVSTGALQVGHLKGDALANAIMKTETKAKRRVTLSICSLGMMDETEAETIPNAKTEPLNITPAKERLPTVPAYEGDPWAHVLDSPNSSNTGKMLCELDEDWIKTVVIKAKYWGQISEADRPAIIAAYEQITAAT